MKNKDLYAVLGVGKDADDRTLKSAYRKLAKKYHPDMNPGDKVAEQKFREATEAYNILSDKDRRRRYDQYGYAAFEQDAEGDGRAAYHFTGGNADDILRGLFGDLFGDFGAAFSGTDDADLWLDAKIPFTVAALGGEVRVRILNETLACRIPAGIQSGMKIRLRGKGYPRAGRPKERGDAYIVVQIEVPRNLTEAEKGKLREFAALYEGRGNRARTKQARSAA